MTAARTVDERERVSVRTPRLVRYVRGVIPLAALVVLALGVWGAFVALGTEPSPARIGETVEVPGGLLRVEGITSESMAAMQPGKFAQSGMSMSASGMDMAPEGYRRFYVEFTAADAGGDGVGLRAGDFRVSGTGAQPVAPLRSSLGDGLVGPGQSLSGSLLFQVPESARDLRLVAPGGATVDLDAPAKEAGRGAHGH
ncbi:Hypothetical Protein RradSPS_1209 [Rubrobacter radiotolerans]|uniref:DUF4352 domain-containing protein n=1 Tax=Rubrobacter radiotolerans TaxID=42256 RepID=A0A023X1Z5_RUBRA|nr:hypothetical protein [Rubrobacter radiotolerans]AHY46492.1 Hypothetical Protein RradSPS_1209 [Rubrobacter radiotolerans]MDX5893899.1 hypothetical protein [Rubrobacter radiotolerans]SMC04725.1 hypothetical protein SAMN00767673_1207 [Rubrobacter radiotolerans DSM 5868]